MFQVRITSGSSASQCLSAFYVYLRMVVLFTLDEGAGQTIVCYLLT